MVMVVAAATTIVFYRLKQPVVLGYILAGFVIGPLASPMALISDRASVDALAELGIIFLMFALGLEFNLRKLKKVGLPAIVAATLEIFIMIAVGYQIGMWLGWGMMNSVFLGAILSISSTTIIVKVLMERGEMNEEFAELAFGILIVEDLLAIVLIALLSGFGEGNLEITTLGYVGGRVLLFVLITAAIGLVLVPRLIDWVSRFQVEEVLVITVVGLAFGAALLAVKLGFSLALGAFLIGAIIAESHAVRRVEHKIVPMRDLFTAVFFVAVGMLIDPRVLVEYAVPILLISVATIVGKVIACSVGSFLAGSPGETSLKVGFSMAQIGEFSFIIAALGLTLGVTAPFLYPVAVAVCALTTLLSPYLIASTPRVVSFLSSRVPRVVTDAGDAYTRAAQRATTSTELLPGVVSRRASRMLVYSAWFIGLFIAGGYASLWLDKGVPDVAGPVTFGEDARRAGGIILIGLLGLPIIVAFAKATEALARDLARAQMFNPRRIVRGVLASRFPRIAARAAAFVGAGLLLALSAWLAWAVHPFPLPRNPIVLAASLAVVGVAGFLLWQRAEKLYVWTEETLDTLLGGDWETPHVRRLREKYPWGVDVEDVPIHAWSWGAYTSLRDLHLRERSGATVLAIQRGASAVPNPHPDLALLPGDRVILVGKREQLNRARDLLQARGGEHREGATRIPLSTQEIAIPGSSPAIGAALGDLKLRERTGARVAWLSRKDGSRVDPAPDIRLGTGDRVMFAGAPDALARVRDLLRVREGP